jgi:hypothetical protein
MKLMHPRLKETDHRYKQRYQDLIQRTSHARHWLELQEKFSIGILAIIPSADFLGCPPFKLVEGPLPQERAHMLIMTQDREDEGPYVSSFAGSFTQVLWRFLARSFAEIVKYLRHPSAQTINDPVQVREHE